MVAGVTARGGALLANLRPMAVPPVSANCKHGAETVVLVVNNVIERHDFKDECKF